MFWGVAGGAWRGDLWSMFIVSRRRRDLRLENGSGKIPTSEFWYSPTNFFKRQVHGFPRLEKLETRGTQARVKVQEKHALCFAQDDNSILVIGFDPIAIGWYAMPYDKESTTSGFV